MGAIKSSVGPVGRASNTAGSQEWKGSVALRISTAMTTSATPRAWGRATADHSKTLQCSPSGRDASSSVPAVNAAVLAEFLWGAGQDTDPLVYITVGTGVGGGVLVNGQLLHGLLHPEIGHLLVPPPQNSGAIQKACHCPFHKSCVEGYVSGTALATRWGVKADALPPDHPAWEEVADVMAHALMNLTLSLCPKRIILGGGVMSQEHILPLIRGQLKRLNNGYLRVSELSRNIDDFIVAPGLGARSGLLGALALGKYELDRHAGRSADSSVA